MPLNIEQIYDCLQNFDFSALFTSESNSHPSITNKAIDIDDFHVRYAIARFMSTTIFEIKSSSGIIPDSQTRERLYKELSYLFPRKLLIFIDKDRTQSLWYWSKRKENKKEKRELFYFKGQPADIFLQKIMMMMMDLGIPGSASPITTQASHTPLYNDPKGELAEYFCRQTIHKVILARVNQQSSLTTDKKNAFKSIDEMLIGLNVKLCQELLFNILPKLSVLDPACGNGIFLVAALNTLSNIYGAVIARIEHSKDNQLIDWRDKIRAEYPDINYYIRQKIMVENLFGVDIDAGAIESTYKNLLAALNSSRSSVDNPIKLLDIGLNIRVGNSLIGLLYLDNDKYKSVQRIKALHDLDQLLLDQSTQQQAGRRDKHKTTKANIVNISLEEIKQLKPFHWGYEFEHRMNERGGFDIIITDPPWEILRSSDQFFNLWRINSDYEYQGVRSPISFYKLFVERCYKLLCHDGQSGMLVPGGIYSDEGTHKLREMLFEKTRITGLFSFENRNHILPEVNSVFKFVLLTFGKKGPTEVFPAAFNRHDVDELIDFSEEHSIPVTTALIRRLSPDTCALLEFQSTIEIQICEKLIQYPFLEKKVDGRWNVVLTQELNVSQDQHIFRSRPGPESLPLYEGRTIQQFTLQPEEVRYWVNETDGRAALLSHKPDVGQQFSYQGYRLGYRSIARSSDARTLIATILPPNTFASNNLYVTENNLTPQELLFLVALLNSFVLDFMLRLRRSMHIGMYHLYQLPIPRIRESDRFFLSIVEHTARLICVTSDFKNLWNSVMPTPWSSASSAMTFADRMRTHTALDALIAHLYNLTEEEFRHMLMTFTLVAGPIKLATENAYRDVERGLIE